ncbi:hypothetical protein NDU88_006896 [Pleurodeles waltl]|uniref:Uncharacterized protein n=1 Tax=Pleurodeles waltl TaxID=8319 RepID=A0AAV7ME60_PLEWA|nr:hypothetical protein NDU88_006896 [Pleurodeles waltl]
MGEGGKPAKKGALGFFGDFEPSNLGAPYTVERGLVQALPHLVPGTLCLLLRILLEPRRGGPVSRIIGELQRPSPTLRTEEEKRRPSSSRAETPLGSSANPQKMSSCAPLEPHRKQAGRKKEARCRQYKDAP